MRCIPAAVSGLTSEDSVTASSLIMAVLLIRKRLGSLKSKKTVLSFCMFHEPIIDTIIMCTLHSIISSLASISNMYPNQSVKGRPKAKVYKRFRLYRHAMCLLSVSSCRDQMRRERRQAPTTPKTASSWEGCCPADESFFGNSFCTRPVWLASTV